MQQTRIRKRRKRRGLASPFSTLGDAHPNVPRYITSRPPMTPTGYSPTCSGTSDKDGRDKSIIEQGLKVWGETDLYGRTIKHRGTDPGMMYTCEIWHNPPPLISHLRTLIPPLPSLPLNSIPGRYGHGTYSSVSSECNVVLSFIIKI